MVAVIQKSVLIGLLLTCLSLRAAVAQLYQVDLSKQTIKLESAGNYRVAQVVDVRADRSRLGGVYTGLDNALASANFKLPFEVALTEFLLRTVPNTTARPVVMRIHSLSVAEETRASAEVGIDELVVDFLEKREQGYAMLTTTGEIIETSGLDVTSKHAPSIAQLLRNSLSQLATLPPNAPAIGTLLSWNEVVAGKNGATTWRYPIQQETLRRGIYRSFAEFRANRPTMSDEPFELTHHLRTDKLWAGMDEVDAYYLYTSDATPRRPVRGDAWGLCDGEKLYIRYRNNYFELQPQGNAFTFIGHRPANPNAVVAGAVLGGLVGAALVGAVSGGQPYPYELHLASGRIVATEPLDDTNASGLAQDTAAIYLYRRPDAVPDQPLTILVEGREIGKLLTNSYVTLNWTDRRRKLTLCVRGPQETCLSFIPDFVATTYLECALPDPEATVATCKQTSTKEGFFYVKKYRAKQLNR